MVLLFYAYQLSLFKERIDCKQSSKMQLTMKSILILLLITFTFSVAAQHSYIPSERTYTTKDGLSSNNILSIYKDSRGFMWIGTGNGLNSFDGQVFTNYSSTKKSQISIHIIHKIMEDHDGFLWLLEANKKYDLSYSSPKIDIFNPQTGKAMSIEKRFGETLPFEIKDIEFVEQLEDGSIFIFVPTQKKGYFYTSNNTFRSIDISKDIIAISDIIIEQDTKSYLLNAFFKKGKKHGWNITRIAENGHISKTRLANLNINLIGKHSTQNVLLESVYISGQNAAAYHILDVELEKESKAKPNSSFIDCSFWNEEANLLWLKSSNRIWAVKKDGTIVFEKKEAFDFLELPILLDGKTTWYSDKRNGLTAITLEPNYFETTQFYPNSFDNSTRGIYAHDDKIWTTTIAGFVHAENGKVEKLFHTHNILSPFMEDNQGQLWYLKNGKLVKEHLSTGDEKAYEIKENYQPWALFEAKNDEIWLSGFQNNEVIAFNTKSETSQLKFKLPVDEKMELNIYHFEAKNDNSVWLATNQGLFVVDYNGKFLATYNSDQEGKNYLPAKDFHHLYQENNGTIWLATGDAGLLQWRMENGRLTMKNHFTTENGLSCNSLHAIYEDENEYLWISSDKGLMQLDKRTNQVYKYFEENGLPNNEFNRISHFQSEDKQLYFGTIFGIINFNPKDFANARKQSQQFPLVVTNFQQFSGKTSEFVDLTTQLTETKTIVLNPNDRFFNIKVALLNFEHDDKKTFEYRIKDLYDWRTTTNYDLNISGLPYGSFVLEIKAKNSKGQEAANILTFPIEVLRPFYLQWWFLALVFGGIGAGIFYFIKWRTHQMLIVQEMEQLKHLEKMKSRFFANISHELRTPITLILAPLSEFIKNNSLNNQQEKQLNTIQNNGKNLLRLVNEVLDLSKLEANKLQLNLSPTKIPQFIERVVANFESAAAVKGIEFQFMSFLQRNVVAAFDQQKLEKILNNLLANALKFTKEGSIQIMAAQVDKHLVIKIKDSGRGILEEDLPYIFDRYFQCKDVAMQGLYEGGTGIGLALTKELVELMNGEISVQSIIDEGTEFTVKLPIELIMDNGQLTTSLMRLDQIIDNEINIEEANLRDFENLLDLKDQEPSDNKKETILLVEDNPSLQEFIHSVLVPHYNVIVKNNGVEALNWLTNHQSPITNHLILSDVMMPEMDGFTLLEKVKSDDRFCSIPFVLLTARADVKDKLRGLRIGVDDYMTKPFEVEELLLRIKNLISNANNRAIAIPEIQGESEENTTIISEKTPISESILPVPTMVELDLEQEERQSSTVELEWLEQIENIVKRELRNKQFTIEDIAYEIHISKRQFARKIKQITGLTPSAYIRNIRLQEARTIFETQDSYTVTEVSFSVGFENVSYFSKIYQETFGKNPKEYLIKI
jgi:signal transduction histidine kinase/DNA-binding response OmpR family regulator